MSSATVCSLAMCSPPWLDSRVTWPIGMRRQLMPTNPFRPVSLSAHRPASSDRNLDHRVFDCDRIGPHWLGGRRVHHLARAHVEHAGVQRALDGPVAPVGVDLTFSQVTAEVGAFVVDGIEAAVDVDQGHFDAFHGDARRGGGRDAIDVRDRHELSHGRLPSIAAHTGPCTGRRADTARLCPGGGPRRAWPPTGALLVASARAAPSAGSRRAMAGPIPRTVASV